MLLMFRPGVLQRLTLAMPHRCRSYAYRTTPSAPAPAPSAASVSAQPVPAASLPAELGTMQFGVASMGSLPSFMQPSSHPPRQSCRRCARDVAECSAFCRARRQRAPSRRQFGYNTCMGTVRRSAARRAGPARNRAELERWALAVQARCAAMA